MSFVNKDSFLLRSFQLGCVLSLFVALLHWLEPLVQYWIGLMRGGIFALFLISGVNQSVFHIKYEVSCRFFTDTPFQTEEVPFFSYFVESFYQEWCCILSNAFFTCIRDLIGLILELDLGWSWKREVWKAAAGGSEKKSLKTCCWIQIANILLRTFISNFVRDIGVGVFCFCPVFVWL